MPIVAVRLIRGTAIVLTWYAGGSDPDRCTHGASCDSPGVCIRYCKKGGDLSNMDQTLLFEEVWVKLLIVERLVP
ncbi:uncharacterized protein OCT59_009616 [Rhizophagus irregularis]|uniref:uncharacterized protein n=1 Tax=Rhizophagus irregularis TaxID=588596 RepID=UPI00332F470F|nr:hypothetical protein OCT59_009616 [Rhizophagus irregularis]